jgi:DNA-binding response OmpR family regulator
MPGEKILVVDDCDTVREIVGDILSEAGFRPLLAPDGATGIEMAQSKIPDLVLVDFIMPKMNGLRFCQMFRNIENLKAVPVVLMSVKADSIGDKFMQVADVADTISKPFTSEALLAVVNHRLRGQTKERPVFAEGQETVMPSVPVISTEQESTEAIARVREKIIAAARKRMDEDDADDGVREKKEKVETLLGEALADVFIMGLTADFRKINPLAGVAAFAGSAEAVSTGDILQLISQSNRTGMLEISEEKKRAAVYMKEGRICFARLWGGSEEFLLGRYLLKDEIVSRDALERLTSQKGTKTLLGERLIKTGLITREELARVLEYQTTEIVYEILRWDGASYTFHPEILSPEAEASNYAISAGELLMEGYRRIDEWRLIEKKGIDDFSVVFVKTGLAADMSEGLSSQEALTLDFVDGSRSINDIIRMTKMASFDVCKILYQLLSMKIIKKVQE